MQLALLTAFRWRGRACRPDSVWQRFYQARARPSVRIGSVARDKQRFGTWSMRLRLQTNNNLYQNYLKILIFVNLNDIPSYILFQFWAHHFSGYLSAQWGVFVIVWSLSNHDRSESNCKCLRKRGTQLGNENPRGRGIFL